MAKNGLSKSDETMARISLLKRIRKLPMYGYTRTRRQRLIKLPSTVLVQTASAGPIIVYDLDLLTTPPVP